MGGPDMALPLANVKVVEVGQNLAGPVASQILADLGARVIKIEKPGGGDDARAWGPPFVDGASMSFHSVNRGKRSVVLDLGDPQGLAALRRLVDGADVFVHNLRPGAAETLGLTAEALRASNPRLIYCEVGAFGHLGPLRRKPAYEILVQAFAGLMSVTGEADGPPVRMGTSVIDYGTGIWTALAALAALYQREHTGRGCVVETSLFETGLFWLARQLAEVTVGGNVPQRHATGSPRLVGFQAFDTQDGPLVVAAGNDRLFARLGEALGHPEWGSDPRFATTADRLKARESLVGEMQRVFLTDTKQRWMDRLEAVGVPCAPILTIPEVLAEPQTRATEMLATLPGLDAEVVRLPLSLDGQRPPLPGRAPRLGEHTEEILRG
jgi:crotonobetainyl-CoA:carnitine CoA-transferase CaiB-like acyl-CoA transferase